MREGKETKIFNLYKKIFWSIFLILGFEPGFSEKIILCNFQAENEQSYFWYNKIYRFFQKISKIPLYSVISTILSPSPISHHHKSDWCGFLITFPFIISFRRRPLSLSTIQNNTKKIRIILVDLNWYLQHTNSGWREAENFFIHKSSQFL